MSNDITHPFCPFPVNALIFHKQFRIGDFVNLLQSLTDIYQLHTNAIEFFQTTIINDKIIASLYPGKTLPYLLERPENIPENFSYNLFVK
jgi:sulfopyruvate decarboxylase TPP-binding subunit